MHSIIAILFLSYLLPGEFQGPRDFSSAKISSISYLQIQSSGDIVQTGRPYVPADRTQFSFDLIVHNFDFFSSEKIFWSARSYKNLYDLSWRPAYQSRAPPVPA